MLLGLVSEKQALSGCLRVVAGWLDKLEAGCSVDFLYEGEDGDGGEEYLVSGSRVTTAETGIGEIVINSTE